MNLKLSDKEASAVYKALLRYLKDLEKGAQEKGVKIEQESVKAVIDRMQSLPGVGGM